jgi:hypothetical protein
MRLKVAVRAIALALALAPLGAPLAVDAQRPAKVPRIGVLAGGFPGADPCLEALRRGLHEAGYVEGQTYVLEPRWSEGRAERFPMLAAELVHLQVDLIVSRPPRLPSCWHRASTRSNWASSRASPAREAM